MASLVEKAMRIAVKAHHEQVRKDEALPYISHPAMVAILLAKHGFDDTVIAAALVHDTVEDTSVTLEDLRRELGEEVTALVAAVSNDNSLGWQDKKRAYIESVRNAPAGAKAVAIADKIHNAESLLIAHAEQGVSVWKHFSAGKDMKLWFESEMLTMIQENWDHPLVDYYAQLVDQLKRLN